MKDRSICIDDGHSCSSSEYEEDDLMECGDFLDLVGLTKEIENGEVDIYMMAERIANLLGRAESLTSSDEEDDDDDDDDDDDEQLNDVHDDNNTRVDWRSKVNNNDVHEHNLLLAGYTNCMDEAIRYLVEEEQYSVEHPVVQGLRQHLVSQQERVLAEARSNMNHQLDADNSNRLAQRVDAYCTIRPPSI